MARSITSSRYMYCAIPPLFSGHPYPLTPLVQTACQSLASVFHYTQSIFHYSLPTTNPILLTTYPTRPVNMRFSTTFALATAATTIHAISFPDVSAVLPDLTAAKRDFEAVKRTISSISIPDIFSAKRDLETRQSGCPAVWTTISKELTGLFLSNGQCNDAARAAIRASFHDCGTWNKAQGNTGGCDGSLILAGELNRPDNNGLQGIGATLQSMAQRYKVGVADMIAFAGSKCSTASN